MSPCDLVLLCCGAFRWILVAFNATILFFLFESGCLNKNVLVCGQISCFLSKSVVVA